MRSISPDQASDAAYEVELARVRARLDEMLKENGIRFGRAGGGPAAWARTHVVGIVLGMAATAALMLIACYRQGASTPNR
jgi:hypothetical protein